MKYTIALALLALVGCGSDTPATGFYLEAGSTSNALGHAKIHRCAAIATDHDIGDQSEEREVAIEPWIYDLLFPPECEVRLLVYSPNMRVIPVRGGAK